MEILKTNVTAFELMQIVIISYTIIAILKKLLFKKSNKTFLMPLKMVSFISIVILIIPLIEVYSGISLYSEMKETILITPLGEFKEGAKDYYLLTILCGVIGIIAGGTPSNKYKIA